MNRSCFLCTTAYDNRNKLQYSKNLCFLTKKTVFQEKQNNRRTRSTTSNIYVFLANWRIAQTGLLVSWRSKKRNVYWKLRIGQKQFKDGQTHLLQNPLLLNKTLTIHNSNNKDKLRLNPQIKKGSNAIWLWCWTTIL